jgi:drug/metabolite transporter (DMT)-like permease
MFNLHFAILLFGLAGIAAKMITVSPSVVVFARTVVGGLALAMVWRCSSGRQAIDRNTVFRLLPSGALLGLHWLTFFLAVKVSTVAIGLLSFATFPVFVAFLEPLMSRTRLCSRDILMALVVFVGLVLVVPSYSLGDHMFQGVLWGLLSAVSFALVTCINKRVVGSTDPIVVGLLQNAWTALFFLPAIGEALSMTGTDIALIAFLGIGCSAIGHTLFVAALRKVRAELAAVTSGLEPLYGIVFAYVLLGEIPSLHTAVGGALILSAVTMASIIDSRRSVLSAVG